MPNPFSLNVITPAGAALIAQATAANQIVFTAALSGTTAATDAADLASKTAAFYDGAAGAIASSSATGSVARIVAQFGNASGASPQLVKSLCILGKLASQTDGEAVIVAAMSDADSSVVLPASTAPEQAIRFPFNLSIEAAEDVTTVYSDGAALSDLARFVSMYKAGDPTQGEAQTILGDKTFSDDVDITGGLGVTGDAVFSDDVEINGGLVVDGAVTEENVTIGTSLSIVGGQAIDAQDTAKIYQNYVTVGSDTAVRLYFGWPNLAADASQVLFDADVYVYGLEIMGALEAGSTAHFNGSTRFESTVEIDDDLTLNNSLSIGGGAFVVDNQGNLSMDGASVDIVDDLSVGGTVSLPGLAPWVVSGAFSIPKGGIIGVCPSGVSGWAQDVPAGTEVTITAGLMPAAAWDCANSRWGACPSGRTIPAGTYTCVTGWDYSSSGSTYGLVLLCRVS